jgi:uncharacterized membrane protein YeiH
MSSRRSASAPATAAPTRFDALAVIGRTVDAIEGTRQSTRAKLDCFAALAMTKN